ncbi:uncharacterized protein AMSG_11529, partial [Thecamonas trahens ATCC 50062]
YVGQVLADARVYSTYASKPAVDLADARLAIQSRANEAFSQVPPRDFLLSLAAKKNAVPLPVVPSEYGVRLPPARNTLTAANYQAPGRVVGRNARDTLAATVTADDDEEVKSKSRKRKTMDDDPYQPHAGVTEDDDGGAKAMDM